VFSLFWEQFKAIMDAAVPFAAQAALVYLIVRFAIAVAALLLDLAESTSPKPQPAHGPEDAHPQQPQLSTGQVRPGIPERASS
jgi:hypothetical protein